MHGAEVCHLTVSDERHNAFNRNHTVPSLYRSHGYTVMHLGGEPVDTHGRGEDHHRDDQLTDDVQVGNDTHETDDAQGDKRDSHNEDENRFTCIHAIVLYRVVSPGCELSP